MKKITIACIFAVAFVSVALSAEDTLQFGRFGKITAYYNSPNPPNIVLFVSGDGGWNLGVIDMARSLASLNAMVVGIDIINYLRQLEQSGEPCSFPAGDFELLSKYIQKKYGYENYITPILVGYSSGATLVYAILAQAPATAYRGAISLGFCPDLPLTKPFCHGNSLEAVELPKNKGYGFLPTSELAVPWFVLQGDIDQVCSSQDTENFVKQVKGAVDIKLPKVGHGFSVPKNWMPQFKESYSHIASDQIDSPQPRVDSSLSDLPLVEVPADDSSGNILAVHITGDGGWGITDKGLSRSLSDSGISVVGLNSLHYFWKSRDPDGAARDLERILRYYLASWKKERAILIGYSFGADVLPFMADRLPPDLLSKIELVALIGPGNSAEFKFHLSDWLGGGASKDSKPVLPEIEKLRGLKMLCFYGDKDEDVICPNLDTLLIKSIPLKGGHLVRGRFDPIAREIISAVKR